MAAPAEWRIHLGAHKTATTHVQTVLAALAPSLDGPERVLVPTSVTRPVSRMAAKAAGSAAWMPAVLRVDGRARLERSVRGARVAVVSEENLLGRSYGLFENPFYVRLAGFGLLERLAKTSRLRLFISVRSYDKLLPSVYYQVLRNRPEAGLQFERARKAMLAGHGGWPELMQRIMDALPGSTLSFWQQERYRDNPRPMLEALTGTRIQQLPEVSVPERTRSPAAGALEEVGLLPRDMEKGRWTAEVEAIFARHPVAMGPPADLLPEDATAGLRTLYRSHLAQMRELYEEVGR